MNHLFKTPTPRFTAAFIGIVAAGAFLYIPASFAYASGSASIVSLNPGSTINVGTPIDFDVSTSGFTNPTFSVSDSFAGTSISTNTINVYSGYFGWTPIAGDVGTHTITITVNDRLGDSATVTQEIFVHTSGSPYLSITNLTPSSSIGVGQQISFFALASGYTSTPTYSVSDSFNGSSVNSSDINLNGEFIWTPTSNDIGTHTITITGLNSLGNSSTVQQIITVSSSGSTVTSSTSTVTPTVTTSVLSSSPSIALSIPTLSTTEASVGQRVAFTTISTGLINPAYAVIDSFNGSTISNSDIALSGQFSWIPTFSDVGTHSIEIIGTDTSGHSASLNLQIAVSSTPSVPVTSPVTTTPVTTTPSAVPTPTAPTITFSASMYPGLQSDDVTNLQTFLTQQGLYNGPVTGYFGDETQAAVESFQTAHGIDAIGTVGPLTLAALNQLSSSGTSATTTAATASPSGTSTATSGSYTFSNLLSVGSTGDDVTALQQKLTALNMYSGPITGYFGSLTEAAVEQFQTANNISAVGYVGPSTRAALNE